MFFFLTMFIVQSCGSGACNVVPNRSFNTRIGQGEYVSLFATGGWAYVPGGYAGLIVYNVGTQQAPRLVAYDRCSTVNPEQGNRVEVEGQLVVDRVSGAKWLLLDGSPAAIAECPLRPYNVNQQGVTFVISN